MKRFVGGLLMVLPISFIAWAMRGWEAVGVLLCLLGVIILFWLGAMMIAGDL